MSKTALAQMNGVAVTAFVACVIAGALISLGMHQVVPVMVGGLVGIYLLFAIKVVRQ